MNIKNRMKKFNPFYILSSFKLGIITFILLLTISVIYNGQQVRSLFQVNIILEKNNNIIHQKFLDSEYYNKQINLYYAEAKNSFESSIFFKQNFDKDLIKMNLICKKFKVNFRYNQYHKVQCLTEKPQFIENEIKLIFENIWKKLHKKQPLKNYSFLSDEEIDKVYFIKVIETKTSPTKNKLKNVLKFNLLVIFFIIVYYLRNKLFKFS